MRIVQIILCLSASFGGYIWYQKKTNKMPFGKFAAACLLLNMIIFYAFAPFAYMYYFVVTVVLAAILLGQMYAEELVSQV
jgi:4-amino-4-deoxy-L-arabinose transferase-like glycosyltransferase